jgi:hypothetical protein
MMPKTSHSPLNRISVMGMLNSLRAGGRGASAGSPSPPLRSEHHDEHPQSHPVVVGATLAHDPIDIGDPLQRQFEANTLPGSIHRLQTRHTRSGTSVRLLARHVRRPSATAILKDRPRECSRNSALVQTLCGPRLESLPLSPAPRSSSANLDRCPGIDTIHLEFGGSARNLLSATSSLGTIHGCRGYFLHDHFVDTADRTRGELTPPRPARE